MKTADAISAFKGVPALAKALGITQAAIYQWGDEVPRLRSYQIRELLADLSPPPPPDFPEQPLAQQCDGGGP